MIFLKLFSQNTRDEENDLLNNIAWHFLKIVPQNVRWRKYVTKKKSHRVWYFGGFSPKRTRWTIKFLNHYVEWYFGDFSQKRTRWRKYFTRPEVESERTGCNKAVILPIEFGKKKRTFEFHEVLPHFVLLHILFKYIKDIKLISKIFAEENNFQDHYVESDILGMFPQKDTVKKTIFQTIM